jgi:hypothetical protein
MPKDYQEIERIVELLKEQYIEKFRKTWGFPLTDEQAEEMDWWRDKIKTTLTTYGNARELEGVEKVEKGVPEEKHATANNNEESKLVYLAVGHNSVREKVLDHIAKVKSELK